MTNHADELVVFGASGHAKVVIDVIEKIGKKVVCIIDDNPELRGKEFFGYRVSGGRNLMAGFADATCIIAIGSNTSRMAVATWLEVHGYSLTDSLVHPSAQIGRGVRLGAGTVLMAGSVVNPDTFVGHSVIINTGATLDHDCTVGDAVHIAPGATVCGGVTVGEATLIGAGAVVHPNIVIGRNVTVGAGATVLTNVPDGAIVVGTPARSIV